ncbi:hypothetical protein JCM24511_09218 [Saitozyma sp. JCM 24511]|nr:hypothetical protein JCM24511_09218 [Saitozyma sp. JCM 24511]
MDFGSISSMSSKSSMRRKSLLQAFRQPRDRQASTSTVSGVPPPSAYTPPPPPSAISSTFYEEPESPYPESTNSHTSHSRSTSQSYSGHGHGGQSSWARHASEGGSMTNGAGGPGSSGMRASGSSWTLPMGMGGRSVSSSGLGGSTAPPVPSMGEGKGSQRVIKRPEDVFRLVRDRLFGWSYLMQWYEGDIHWLQTVKIPRSTIEAALGAKQLESRARNFLVLGMSLAPLFDIANVHEFLRALARVLDEWESFAEGGGGKVRSRKAGSGSGEYFGADAESSLVYVHTPFHVDFFQVHSTACSIIRDIYKKVLRSILPLAPASRPLMTHNPELNLLHPSTIIHSAPLDSAYPVPSERERNDPKSPSASSTSGSPWGGGGVVGGGRSTPDAAMGGVGLGEMGMASASQTDALQALIAGELPADRTLVGDGQKLTPGVIDLLLKVDGKLKKHFSILLREGDALARRVLDDEISMVLSSLSPGSGPMRFDINVAMSGQGNGYIPETPMPHSAATSTFAPPHTASSAYGGVGGVGMLSTPSADLRPSSRGSARSGRSSNKSGMGAGVTAGVVGGVGEMGGVPMISAGRSGSGGSSAISHQPGVGRGPIEEFEDAEEERERGFGRA